MSAIRMVKEVNIYHSHFKNVPPSIVILAQCPCALFTRMHMRVREVLNSNQADREMAFDWIKGIVYGILNFLVKARLIASKNHSFSGETRIPR